MEKISVIVPIYNSEAFLEKCLDSVLSQTYPNIEVVLINDGSSDNSGLICRDYEAKHDNIKYFELEENRGVAHSRNLGIRNAQGSLIGFVDSDDWIEKDMYASLHDTLTVHNVLMASANFRLVSYDTQKDKRKVLTHKRDLYIDNPIDALLYTITNRDIILWNKLYRCEVFNGIVFPEGTIYEDIGAMHKLIENAGQIAVSTKCLYNYYLQPVSITRDKKVTVKIFEHLQVVIDRYEYLSSRYDSAELELLCKQQIFATLINIVDNLNHLNITDYKDIYDAFNQAKSMIYEKYSLDDCGFSDEQKRLLKSLDRNIVHYKISRDLLAV